MTAHSGHSPLSFDDLLEAVYLQASDLLNAGQTPRVLEVGATQDGVLREAGVADTLVIGAGREIGDPSIFRHPGDAYSRTEIERVEPRVDRVEREDWLQVTTGEQA